jgi:hypothetical protein
VGKLIALAFQRSGTSWAAEVPLASWVDNGDVKIVVFRPNTGTDISGPPLVACIGFEGELELETAAMGGKDFVQERVYDIAQFVMAVEPHGRKFGAGEAVDAYEGLFAPQAPES